MAQPRRTDARTHQNIRRHQRLRGIGMQVEPLQRLLTQATEAIALTLPDGYPSGGVEPVSGGDVSRPVEGVILAHESILDSVEDPTELEARRVGLAAVDTSLTVIERALGEIHTELSRLAARITAGKVKARTNMVDCAACERPVAGTPNDRAKAGYCPACWTAWLRAGRPDRAQFERSRRGITDDVEVVVHTAEPPRPGHVPQVGAVSLTVGAQTIDLPADLAARLAELGTSPTREDLHDIYLQARARVGS